jgi:hypothetical protein
MILGSRIRLDILIKLAGFIVFVDDVYWRRLALA